MAVIIHPAHRKLAELVQMIIDHHSGELKVRNLEMRLLFPLLMDNLMLVRETDELKNLALEAQTAGDMDWVQEITVKLDEMEAKYS
ncbi:hypothetical protein SAMN05661091_4108 [Paenibacillus uliginis N3/975]|uniref:Uncharacterized protein n=1 Tax=Paenibacillus uliginis N3/975 TaxID=1313296 RepID=A0A1X7HK69_9BACL|nr:hypothetical protein [Paenibacillus uliginis]SMF88090.1 hypothetical protein SAMN05661091_4108 [Paenibacillus uliginis N3/975]